MTTESPARNSMFSESGVWIPVGMLIGLLVDRYLYDTTIGMSIGLMTGGVVTLIVERKRKKSASRLSIAVGVLAIIVVAGTEIIGRA
jgi:hypothetical protein